MSIEHHSLINEFPEYRERIHALKVGDPHFAKLFDQYHEVDREVVRVEAGIEPRSDFYLEDLKKLRLQIKDELYQKLRALENL